jgi:hypothetical protein
LGYCGVASAVLYAAVILAFLVQYSILRHLGAGFFALICVLSFLVEGVKLQKFREMVMGLMAVAEAIAITVISPWVDRN